MNNHVHFICIPHKESSLSKTFNTLHKYSQYFNKKKRARGHLWQGRFYSCILDEKHLHACIRYIENNPVRAKVVENAEDYKWSSAKGHIIKGSDPLLSEDCHIEQEKKDWRIYLTGREDKEIIEAIKKNSSTGRPCGNDSFIEKIERLLERELKAKAWGRPRKKR